MSQILRPEARPITWQFLDSSQKAATRTIAGLLKAAIDGLPLPGRSTEPVDEITQWVIDEDRSNRVAFLSGERGTGKTTVLLSLKKFCELFQRRPSASTDLPEELRGILQEISQKVVWLEPIDMEPLPESANLLAAIVARIDDAVQPPPHGHD